MPIGDVANPHFIDFANRTASSRRAKRDLIGEIRKIQHASLKNDSGSKFNLAHNSRFVEFRNEEFSRWQLYSFPNESWG